MRARAHSAAHEYLVSNHTIRRGTILLPRTFSSHLARKLLLFTPLSKPDALQQRAVHRLKDDVCLWPREVDQAQPRTVRLVLRRSHDTVHGALQIPAAQELERVGDVDNDRVPWRPDVLPLPLGRLHLQARHRLVEQERKRVVVGVPLGPNIPRRGVLLPRTGEVPHVPQVLEPLGVIAVPPHEEVLVLELQNSREQSQQREQQRVVHPAREVADLLPVVEDRLRVRPLVLRRELGDVVSLVIVPRRQLASRLRLVAPEVAGRRVTLVLQLLLQRQV